jgi:predicted dehydrogenase
MAPKLLLIGCGKFGRNYLRILKGLHAQKKIILTGVATSTKESSETIAKQESINTYYELDAKLLKEIDGVFIVTPSSTHFQIAKKCLSYTNVFVEKPLALNSEEIIELDNLAKSFGRKLMVGHIYRFSNLIEKIKDLLKKSKPEQINIRFLGGMPAKDCGALHEFIHPFDILDYLLEEPPIKIAWIESKINFHSGFEEYAKIEMQYTKTKAIVEVGWLDYPKERSIFIKTNDKTIKSDNQNLFVDDLKIDFALQEPLNNEINRFIEIIQGKNLYFPDARLALRIEKIISKIKNNISRGQNS